MRSYAVAVIASDPAGLVGRLREFDRLIALLDDAVARRGGGAVSITGEPGIGKSALVGAVTGHARASGWAVLEGRGHDLESLLAFGPLAAALGGHLHRMPRARRLAYTEGLRSLGTVVEGLGTDGPPGRRDAHRPVARLPGRGAAARPDRGRRAGAARRRRPALGRPGDGRRPALPQR
ncbi:hypothetical protein GCM10017691_45750 [Pseudonocardia petroleophila]